MTELAGKTAIVTGASRGIGAAAARELANRGVAVLLLARSSEAIGRISAEIRASGGTAACLTCDVADFTAVQKAVDTCLDHFGRVDILVNNAGLIEPVAPLAECDPALWSRIIDVNCKGVYHGMRATIPVMERQGGGIIITVSSGAAIRPLSGWSHYCASKAAALMLTRSAHLEYASRHIRVIGLAPGTVATDMQVAIRASGINPISQLDPAVHAPVAWPARAIAWLCTEDARAFDGGDVSLHDAEIRQRIGLPPL